MIVSASVSVINYVHILPFFFLFKFGSLSLSKISGNREYFVQGYRFWFLVWGFGLDFGFCLFVVGFCLVFCFPSREV